VRPRRTVRQRLADILSAIQRIELYTREKSFDDFTADSMLRDSVERNIERISEATRHLPDALTARHPEIPWRAIGDIGNVFRHAYDDVDAGQTWRVVARDLQSLKAAIGKMIAGLGPDE
jgi:uncharacterized protein with HEPN domain